MCCGFCVFCCFVILLVGLRDLVDGWCGLISGILICGGLGSLICVLS